MFTPKAILFDLDDTIISFDGKSDLAWDEVCRSFIREYNPPFGHSILLAKINEIRKWYWSDAERNRVGRADMLAARRLIVSMALRALNFYNEEMAVTTADRYSSLQDSMLCLFEGAYEALKVFRSLGIKMAVITNGVPETQRKKLARFGLGEFFDAVLISGEVGYEKPDIRIFRAALDALALSPGDCWMIGDNLEWDIETPKKLGIFSIWNDYKKKALPEGSAIVPDKIVTSIYELAVELRSGGM